MIYPYRFAVQVKFERKLAGLEFMRALHDNPDIRLQRRQGLTLDKQGRFCKIEFTARIDEVSLRTYLRGKGFPLTQESEGIVTLSEPQTVFKPTRAAE